MSVSLKNSEEIRVITGGLLYHKQHFRDIIEGSEIYVEMKKRVGEFYKIDEYLENDFICWLMYRMWVANKVAFAVQYPEEKVFVSRELPEVVPVDVDLEYLSGELRSLNHNIYTNGGQYWLDHAWHCLFESITARIKEKSQVCCAGGVL